MTRELEKTIEELWQNKESIKDVLDVAVKNIGEALDLLCKGKLRVAEKINGQWQVHQWLKKAILLSFRVRDNSILTKDILSFDKVPLKFNGWDTYNFSELGSRVVPGALVRSSAHIEENVVLMPCFINVGAYVGSGTMIDTWSTVGSCAQIGKNCHISGGVGIGGVLEPLQASPVIIEDNCFIGARSEIAEGVIVEEGSVISMGVFIGASTKIIDRQTGEVFYGRVPAYSVVVPGTVPSNNANPNSPNLACAVIIKKVDERTRSKTSINDLLRD